MGFPLPHFVFKLLYVCFYSRSKFDRAPCVSPEFRMLNPPEPTTADADNPSKYWFIITGSFLGILIGILVLMLVWRAYSQTPMEREDSGSYSSSDSFSSEIDRLGTVCMANSPLFKTGDYVRLVHTVTWLPGDESEKSHGMAKLSKSTGQIIDSGTNHCIGAKV